MSSELTKRILFGVVAAPVAVGIVLYGGWPLAALLAVASALGAWEFFRIARATGLTPFDDLGIAIAGIVPLLVHARYLRLYDPDASIGVGSLAMIGLLLLFALSIWTRGVAGKPLGSVAATAFGVAYTGCALSYGYAIRYHEYAFAPATMHLGSRAFDVPSGGLLLLLPLLVTWASDIGAYAFGRTFGRHKLIPSVSPGKTVEGALGGLMASVIVAWLYSRFLLRPDAHLGFRWEPVGVIAFGALVSVAAQVGDLAESLIKREGGVKDSSRIIPGHGGVLDRVDSLLFVLPIAFVVFGGLLTWAPT
ncbi:MAG TPA: phosphatidate cytidylyltransferase [Gemmatimonadaceae bacterium]|jgi:phosphatidate cytidylyltransferase|nr:phosphatidate cytidylyltransferase [Gemmatimonadaceae bacterium]